MKFIGFTICLVAAFLGAGPGVAQGEHNFVLLYEPPNAAKVLYQPQFVDTASVRRDGDNVSLDVLEANWLRLITAASPPPPPVLIGQIKHVQLSCAWWTSGQRAEDSSYDSEGNLRKGFGSGGAANTIVGSQGADAAFLDKICTGGRLNGDNGFKSVRDALAWAKQNISPPGPPLMGRYRPTPPSPAWMMGQSAHRFVPVTAAAAGATGVYLDIANLKRQGSKVDGLSLLILGAEEQRNGTSYGAVVAMRYVLYDCAHPSMTVEGQATWTRFGDYSGSSDDAFLPRPASVSPVIAAEIAAACSPDKRDQASGWASVEDVWAHAHNLWPPYQSDSWSQASCIWSRLPEDFRHQVTAWLVANPNTLVGVKDTLLNPTLQACGITAGGSVLQYRLGRYSRRQAAIEGLLASRQITEQQLHKSWSVIPWPDRRLLEKVETQFSPQERQAAEATIAKSAAAMGLSAESDKHLYADFIKAEAFFDVD